MDDGCSELAVTGYICGCGIFLNVMNSNVIHSQSQALNPMEIFAGVMIDYDYVELTSSCITALQEFRKAHPYYRAAEIDKSFERGMYMH